MYFSLSYTTIRLPDKKEKDKRNPYPFTFFSLSNISYLFTFETVPTVVPLIVVLSLWELVATECPLSHGTCGG